MTVCNLMQGNCTLEENYNHKCVGSNPYMGVHVCVTNRQTIEYS